MSTPPPTTTIDINEAVQLVPIHSCTREPLLDGDRPSLTMENPSAILFLGTNDACGILDPKLSHKVIKIYIKRNKLFAFCLPDGSGKVKLNESIIPTGCRRELKKGDLLSLEGSDDDDYIYRVQQQPKAAAVPSAVASAATAAAAAKTTTINADNTTNQPSAAAATAASTPAVAAAAAGPAAEIQQDVGEETICAVCMEIMVEPRTIVPCGHSFCNGCLTTQMGSCAECRGPIQQTVACRALTNLIERLVDASDQQNVPVFEKDDVDSYRSRTNQNNKTSSSSSSLSSYGAVASRRKRRRQAAAAAAVHVDDGLDGFGGFGGFGGFFGAGGGGGTAGSALDLTD